MLKKCIAEGIGTMLLVVFGCGVAVVSGGNLIATALAFGLVIVALAYSIGDISGCHVNPAVSFAMFLSRKMSGKDFLLYCASQVIGAIVGAVVVGIITGSFATVGGNAVSSGLILAYDKVGSLFIGFLIEILLTFAFVFAILGVTSKTENKTVTGVVIGLTLTLVHLLGINLTGTSVNPARSIGPALIQAFAGNTTALSQIWIFILAPIVGAGLAAIVFGLFQKKQSGAQEEKSEKVE